MGGRGYVEIIWVWLSTKLQAEHVTRCATAVSLTILGQGSDGQKKYFTVHINMHFLKCPISLSSQDLQKDVMAKRARHRYTLPHERGKMIISSCLG